MESFPFFNLFAFHLRSYEANCADFQIKLFQAILNRNIPLGRNGRKESKAADRSEAEIIRCDSAATSYLLTRILASGEAPQQF